MTGLSTGLISQIERDKVIPTITAMLKIVHALDVTMGYFFDEEQNQPIVMRKNERQTLKTNGETRIYELLTPIHDKNPISFNKIKRM